MRNFIQKLFIGSLFLVCLLSCGSVEVRQSDPSLMSPENQGRIGLGGGLEVGSLDQYELTPDASRRPPILKNEKLNSSPDLRGGLNYAFDRNFELGAALTAYLGMKGHIKYSFLTESSSPFKLAVYGQVFFDSTNRTGDQSGNFGAGGYNWAARGQSRLTVFGPSLGYRFNDEVLIFANYGIGSSALQLKISQDPGSGDPGGAFTTSTKANVSNLGLGLVLGKSTPFTIGATYTVKKWQDEKLGQQYNTALFAGVNF